MEMKHFSTIFSGSRFHGMMWHIFWGKFREKKICFVFFFLLACKKRRGNNFSHFLSHHFCNLFFLLSLQQDHLYKACRFWLQKNAISLQKSCIWMAGKIQRCISSVASKYKFFSLHFGFPQFKCRHAN